MESIVDMSDVERELGRLAQAAENITDRVNRLSDRASRIEDKLDEHINDENQKLDTIKQQLSLTRFLWLTVKAVILTIAFLVAFKFGDISGLWRELK